MRIHVVLERDVRTQPGKLVELEAFLREQGGLQNVNEARLHRYGIITGDIDPELVDWVRAVPGVQSVDVDSVKRISRPPDHEPS